MFLVCHVNLARGFRGGERQTELLVRELARRGLKQRAIVRKGDELARRLDGVPGLDLRPIGRPFAFHAAVSGGCLLHAHESKAAHFAHFCNRLMGVRYLVTRRVDNPPSGSYFTRDLYRRADAVVAISSAIRARLSECFPGLTPRLIPSVQAGMTADPQARARLRGQWPGKFLIGHAGALDNSQKGQIYLIRAARRLARDCPQLQFVVLGEGKDEAWLRREAADLQNVSFQGQVTSVGDWLSAFDLFVFPSLHEGLGSVLLDAMSFGLPIVASNVDGIPDIVRDGENGLLIPPADDMPLAEALSRLYADADLRAHMGAAGRRIAAEHTPDVMADAYMRIYQTIKASSAREPHG